MDDEEELCIVIPPEIDLSGFKVGETLTIIDAKTEQEGKILVTCIKGRVVFFKNVTLH